MRDLLDSNGEPVDVKRITVSNTRINDFEKCKFLFKLKHLDRVPEPARPLKEGQVEQPNERGQRIHEAAETYVRGGVELLPELTSFAPEFARLRDLFAAGKVSLECEWAFDENWLPVGYWSDDVTIRIKPDAIYFHDEKTAVLIDYKTGRKDGNEFKHAEQMALYQLAAFLKYPELETVYVELWYLDKNEITQQSYTRKQGLRHVKPYTERIIKIVECTEFPPASNQFACRFCYYGQKKGSGACQSEV